MITAPREISLLPSAGPRKKETRPLPANESLNRNRPLAVTSQSLVAASTQATMYRFDSNVKYLIQMLNN